MASFSCILQCFGPNFFHKCWIGANLISSKFKHTSRRDGEKKKLQIKLFFFFSSLSRFTLSPLYTRKTKPFLFSFVKLATDMHNTYTLLPSFAHSMPKPYLPSFSPPMASFFFFFFPSRKANLSALSLLSIHQQICQLKEKLFPISPLFSTSQRSCLLKAS